MPSLWRHFQKTPNRKRKTFFSISNRRLAEFVKGLNSSLPLAAGDFWPKKGRPIAAVKELNLVYWNITTWYCWVSFHMEYSAVNDEIFYTNTWNTSKNVIPSWAMCSSRYIYMVYSEVMLPPRLKFPYFSGKSYFFFEQCETFQCL